MKKPLLFNLKHLLVLSLSIGISLNASAQEKTKEISSPEKVTPEPAQLEKSEIITFPIKAKTTTDPNYEINKQKSIKVQKRFDTTPSPIIKDEQYYLDQIQEYKRRIKEIENGNNSGSVNPDKLESLQLELEKIEKEYTDFKKSK